MCGVNWGQKRDTKGKREKVKKGKKGYQI